MKTSAIVHHFQYIPNHRRKIKSRKVKSKKMKVFYFTFISTVIAYLVMSKRLSYIGCILLAFTMFASCGNKQEKNGTAVATDLVTYPEKGEMRLLTDRPPQLETPLNIFKQDFTPNEYFFVRWHLAQILTRIDIDTFRLRIGGSTEHTLALSMEDLRTKFPADSIVAIAVCAGNSRATFNPRVPGSQWQNGAMGNAKWKGVKLKHILTMAGIKPGAVDVTFQGMDRPVLPGTPAFIKSLGVNHAMDGEVLVAYEMNGSPIPMLNGYPLKLVVPGWYATYWVGALNEINVLQEKYHGFWMDKAYLIAKNPQMSESPTNLSKETTPLTNINLHSIFVAPEASEKISANKPCHIEGLAFNDGTGLQKVELSTDGGKTWAATTLDPELGKYAWRRWKYEWAPPKPGPYHLCVKATDINGKTQPEQQWNRSGYARGFIERLDVNVN
jgi:DMSO/TMAO reductase YedYZ molybdopterin-dependent catalytic subunit